MMVSKIIYKNRVRIAPHSVSFVIWNLFGQIGDLFGIFISQLVGGIWCSIRNGLDTIGINFTFHKAIHHCRHNGHQCTCYNLYCFILTYEQGDDTCDSRNNSNNKCNNKFQPRELGFLGFTTCHLITRQVPSSHPASLMLCPSGLNLQQHFPSRSVKWF